MVNCWNYIVTTLIFNVLEVFIMASDGMNNTEAGFWFIGLFIIVMLVACYGSYKVGYSYTETARLRAQAQCNQDQVDQLENKINTIWKQTKKQREN